MYSFSGWDHSGCGDGSAPFNLCNLICYKSDRFDLLDEGFFFLNHDEHLWTFPAWDHPRPTDIRTASWAKLQPKGSDVPFYFVSVHQTFNGTWGRAFELQIMIDRLWRIAGNAPIVMCGDMNHKPSRRDLYYTTVANFSDAYILNNSDCGLDYSSTSSKWSGDVTSGSRIDYLFTRYMTVNSYRHIDETYGNPLPPSDHYPIMANITLQVPQTHTFCVDPVNGSDDNSGHADAPVATVTKAIQLALGGDSIKLAAAQFNETSIQVTKNLKFFGGYNSDFTEVVGKSTLLGTEEKRIMNVNATFGAELHNMVFRGASRLNGSSDGGTIVGSGYLLKCVDCEFYDNHASRDGGAIQFKNQLILERCIFEGNSAGRNGGAFCTIIDNQARWYNMVVHGCYFKNNTAADGSTGYLPKFIWGWVDGNTFEGNNATDGSTLYCQGRLDNGTLLESHLTVWNNTFVNNTATDASAVKVDIEDGAPLLIVNNTIVNNTSTGNNYAVNLLCSSPQLWNNIIACNYGGDFAVNTDGYSDSNNLVTTKTSCMPVSGSRDFFTDSFETTATELAKVLDGTVAADGSFVPNLTLPEEQKPVAVDALFYIGSAGVKVVPVVAMLQPDFNGKSLRMIPQTRLSEKLFNCDFNYDGESWDYLSVDQLGNVRPIDGTATVGAVECAVESSVAAVRADGITRDDVVYDLFGRCIKGAPTAGIYIVNGHKTAVK